MFQSARIRSDYSIVKRGSAHWILSLLAHGALVTVGVLWPTLVDWNPPPEQPTVRELLDQYTVLYYNKSDLLPMIAPSPASRAASPPATRDALPTPSSAVQASSPKIRLAPARASQPIVSDQSQSENRRQTIVQPDAPDIVLPRDVDIPNLVATNREMPAPPPPARDYASQRIARLTLPPQPVAEPVQKPVVRAMPKSEPEAPQIGAGRIRVSEIQLSPVQVDDLPTPQVAVRLRREPTPPMSLQPVPRAKAEPAPPSGLAPGALRTEQLPSQQGMGMAELPTFPVPVKILRPAPAPGNQRVAKTGPTVPNIEAWEGIQVPSELGAMPTLVAVSLNAPPPDPEVQVPVGNRAGAFAADSQGVWSQGGSTGDSTALGKAATENGPGATSISGGIAVPGLSVRGEPSELGSSPAVSDRRTAAPGPAPRTASRELLAGLSRPILRPEVPARGAPVADPFFGARRVYTARVNMPNLTSSNGSWVLRFAEPQGREGDGELSTPVVISKVDPSYAAGAQRERIQGFVMLAGMVGTDGTISNVKLVRGLDSRLDLSAISAFTQWKFQPARRDGKPVALEVLVQIPFAVN